MCCGSKLSKENLLIQGILFLVIGFISFIFGVIMQCNDKVLYVLKLFWRGFDIYIDISFGVGIWIGMMTMATGGIALLNAFRRRRWTTILYLVMVIVLAVFLVIGGLLSFIRCAVDGFQAVQCWTKPTKPKNNDNGESSTQYMSSEELRERQNRDEETDNRCAKAEASFILGLLLMLILLPIAFLYTLVGISMSLAEVKSNPEGRSNSSPS